MVVIPSSLRYLSRDMINQQSECVPSKDSNQPRHPPSLIRVFAVCMKKPWVFSYPLSAQRRLWSDWADAQADLSLRWAHSHFVGFVMSRLICLSLFICSGLTSLSTIFHDSVWMRQGAQCSVLCAASLTYHAPDTWHDTIPSHMIPYPVLTLGRSVLLYPVSLSANEE